MLGYAWDIAGHEGFLRTMNIALALRGIGVTEDSPMGPKHDIYRHPSVLYSRCYRKRYCGVISLKELLVQRDKEMNAMEMHVVKGTNNK